MKLLLLLLVIGVVAWLLTTRGRSAVAPPKPKRPPAAPETATMVVCVHCAVHLPRGEALTDAAGRLYCSAAHRLAGPPG